jgi:hypothetical protein
LSDEVDLIWNEFKKREKDMAWIFADNLNSSDEENENKKMKKICKKLI